MSKQSSRTRPPASASVARLESGSLKATPTGRVHADVAGPSKQTYIIEDRLGKGAYGVVYRARDRQTGETVAVKRVDLTRLGKADVQKITSEVELLQCLKHPNIVRYKGSRQTQSHLHIVLEYCQNGSLRDILKRFGKIPERLAAVYIRQVLSGLEYLHRLKIVHRDIKAANILAMADGSVKLADFGLAIKAGERTIEGTDFAGSPYWMAPEAVEQCKITPASDIWSVGCLVLELVTSKPPYFDLEPLSALFNIVDRGCPVLPDGLSPDAITFLEACLAKRISQRPSAGRLLRYTWLPGDDTADLVESELEQPCAIASPSDKLMDRIKRRAQTMAPESGHGCPGLESCRRGSSRECVHPRNLKQIHRWEEHL